MAIDFISDLHLDRTRPAVNEYFITYLNNISKDVTDLYILGDLFEYWVGDDDPMDDLNEVRTSITILGSKINIWYMHGNRDFLISKKICKNLNMKLLNDPTVILKNELKLLLLHGDTLCTDDTEYQNFRSLVRSDEWQTKMLSKSLEERLSLAENLRMKSIEANVHKDEDIMDVNMREIDLLIEKYKPDIIIHGHTHRPNIHTYESEEKKIHRYVLGDWYDRFFILSLKNRGFIVSKGNLK
jgi:UDP-2,3-diacylglucosamine hydrolase